MNQIPNNLGLSDFQTGFFARMFGDGVPVDHVKLAVERVRSIDPAAGSELDAGLRKMAMVPPAVVKAVGAVGGVADDAIRTAGKYFAGNSAGNQAKRLSSLGTGNSSLGTEGIGAASQSMLRPGIPGRMASSAINTVKNNPGLATGAVVGTGIGGGIAANGGIGPTLGIPTKNDLQGMLGAAKNDLMAEVDKRIPNMGGIGDFLKDPNNMMPIMAMLALGGAGAGGLAGGGTGAMMGGIGLPLIYYLMQSGALGGQPGAGQSGAAPAPAQHHVLPQQPAVNPTAPPVTQTGLSTPNTTAVGNTGGPIN
jgi:hypothetical protein